MNSAEGDQFHRLREFPHRETTQVASISYDVGKLEEYLETHLPKPEPVEVGLNNLRLSTAVEEGNKYWDVPDSNENIGPSHFLKKWHEQKSENSDLTVDEFLENLKQTEPTWIEHILSIQNAQDNMDKPIWMHSNPSHHPFPFDGMHRLTRAYLEGRSSIPVIFWDRLPDNAII